jgi:16S rRNA (uracil1498-N3)-methyltransferase
MTRRRWIADEFSPTRAAITADNAVHLARVLRAHIGQEFEIVCGDQVRLGRVAFISAKEDRVEFELKEIISDRTAGSAVHLLLAIFKFDRMEWAIEKVTELGVQSIAPVIASRTDAHLASAASKRVERWRKLGREASQQSRRSMEPKIDDPIDLKSALQQVNIDHLRLVLSETEKDVTLKAAIEAGSSHLPLHVAVGPEGGWTDQELHLFVNSGWQAVSLGTTILRAETAAIAAVAIARACGLKVSGADFHASNVNPQLL